MYLNTKLYKALANSVAAEENDSEQRKDAF